MKLCVCVCVFYHCNMARPPVSVEEKGNQTYKSMRERVV